MAAHRGGIKKVLIPDQNVRDLAEIPQNVKSALEIVPVKWIDQVLDLALSRAPTPLPDEEEGVAAQTAAAATESLALGSPPAEPLPH